MPYAIGGALAYGYWGAARATKDVDLNLFLPPEGLEKALLSLQDAGLAIDVAQALRSAAERGDAVGWYGKVRVDLFANSIPLHEEAARRVVVVDFAGERLKILSAEDTCVLKLLFFRPKDLLDVERLVALQGEKLDRAYVRRWLLDAVEPDDDRLRKWDEICAAIA